VFYQVSRAGCTNKSTASLHVFFAASLSSIEPTIRLFSILTEGLLSRYAAEAVHWLILLRLNDCTFPPYQQLEVPQDIVNADIKLATPRQNTMPNLQHIVSTGRAPSKLSRSEGNHADL
jgi:hypothetical protein